MAEQKKWGIGTEPMGTDPTESSCETGQVGGDVADLLEWCRKSKGRGVAPTEAVRLRDRVRLFTRKQKEAVLLGFLLAEAIPDEQLDAMIEGLMRRG